MTPWILAFLFTLPHSCAVTATGVADAFFSGHKEVCGKPLTKGESSQVDGDLSQSFYALHVEGRAYELRVAYGWDGRQEVDEISIKLAPR